MFNGCVNVPADDQIRKFVNSYTVGTAAPVTLPTVWISAEGGSCNEPYTGRRRFTRVPRVERLGTRTGQGIMRMTRHVEQLWKAAIAAVSSAVAMDVRCSGDVGSGGCGGPAVAAVLRTTPACDGWCSPAHLPAPERALRLRRPERALRLRHAERALRLRRPRQPRPRGDEKGI